MMGYTFDTLRYGPENLVFLDEISSEEGKHLQQTYEIPENRLW